MTSVKHPPDFAPFVVQGAQFLTSAPTLQHCPPLVVPEIAFVGRSNVGKSSCINTLLCRKSLAKTSNTPGKTRLMNFYEVKVNDRDIALVDLPGYGYAKVSKTEQQDWKKAFEAYLVKRGSLVLVIHLVDGRHPMQANDIQMCEWLAHHHKPVQWVLTKIDKTKPNEWKKHQQALAKYAKKGLNDVIPFSSQLGPGQVGVQHLWSAIADACAIPARVPESPNTQS